MEKRPEALGLPGSTALRLGTLSELMRKEGKRQDAQGGTETAEMKEDPTPRPTTPGSSGRWGEVTSESPPAPAQHPCR